jgi:Integrase core domain
MKPNGPLSNSERPFPGILRRAICYGTARIFGKDFVDPVKAMGIQPVLCAPRSPWQRAYIEPVIGTMRRECLDPMIVFGEGSLYRHLQNFINYYHRRRTHLALAKDSPEPRPVQPPGAGRIITIPDLGGLHHRYEGARRLNGILSSYQQRPSLLRQAPVSNPVWKRTVYPPVRLSAVKNIAALDQLPLELVPNRGEPIPENDSVTVVERTTKAVNYRNRGGATKIDFRGTPLSWRKLTARPKSRANRAISRPRWNSASFSPQQPKRPNISPI